jgi:small subunit ribosomal protein S21
LEVSVSDNNIDQALRVLKKKLQREGVFKEMRNHRFYEKPSEKKARKKVEARRRLQKSIRTMQNRLKGTGQFSRPRHQPFRIGLTTRPGFSRLDSGTIG